MSRSTELVNARLVQVLDAGGGSTDTYEGPGVEGPEKWAGDVGVWFDERRQRKSAAAGSSQTDLSSDVGVLRELVVSEDLEVEILEGDTVVFRRQPPHDETEVHGKVQLVDLPDLPRGEGGEVRLTLELA